MIVSDLESLVVRVLLGGALDASDRGRLTPEASIHVEALLVWCAAPGITQAAAEEIASGGAVRPL